MQDAKFWIEHLGLTRHPEGGWYRETYRSRDGIPGNCLPARYQGARDCSTAIYFLLESGEFSAFHRLNTDELWHFHTGSSLTVYSIDIDGKLTETKVGPNPSNGESFQAVITAGNWFGARVDPPGSFSLISCTVSPGFDFTDFELAGRNDLIRQFPHHQEIIEELTR